MDVDQVVSYLLEMNICTKSHIIQAIQHVHDPTNFDEIMNYILDNPHNDYHAEDFKDNEIECHDLDIQSSFEALSKPITKQNNIQKQPLTDFMWKCHKCDTWYLQSEVEFSTKCVSFKQQPSYIINPQPFTYHGYNARIVAFGYVRDIQKDSHFGIEVIAQICFNYLQNVDSLEDEWHFPLGRAHKYGKDLSIYHINSRLQYRADNDYNYPKQWRTAFGSTEIFVGVTVWRIVAVNNIKDIIMGICASECATTENATKVLSDLSQETHRFAVDKHDIITIKVNLNALQIAFFINDCEIRQSEMKETTFGCWKLGVSLCNKYDAIEMMECDRIQISA